MAYAFPADIDPSVDGSVSQPVSGPSTPQVWTQTVISQYANSPILLGMLQSIADAIDPAPLIDDFYNNVWNLDTARGYGLDVWGRIVGVSRVLTVIGGSTGKTFGFKEAGRLATGFNQAPFYPGPQATLVPNFALADSVFRRLILAKALANITPRSITAMNNSLMLLFKDRGKAFVVDRGGMSLTLTFDFLLLPVDVAILTQSGAFPAPSGVLVDISSYQLPRVFGFAEAGSSVSGFGYGSFIRSNS